MIDAITIVLIAACSVMGGLLVLLSRNLRLLTNEHPGAPHIGREKTFVDRMVQRFADMSGGAGVRLLPREIMLLSIIAGVVPVLASQLMGVDFFPSLFFGAVGLLLLPLWIFLQRKRNLGSFENQLGNAMPLIASNLRAGLTLRQSLVPVGENMGEPIKSEFKRVTDEVTMGTPMTESLDNLAERVKSTDLKLFSTAVSIQSSQGGSIADITEQVGATIRSRSEVRQLIKSRTAMANVSTLVMTGIPVLVFVAIMGISDMHRSFYLSAPGMLVLGVCLVMNALGWVVMKNMSRFE